MIGCAKDFWAFHHLSVENAERRYFMSEAP